MSVATSNSSGTERHPFNMTFLTQIANRAVNEVCEIYSVTCDITSILFGKIEWE
jgi:GMP synthase PP-ATPase subunit